MVTYEAPSVKIDIPLLFFTGMLPTIALFDESAMSYYDTRALYRYALVSVMPNEDGYILKSTEAEGEPSLIEGSKGVIGTYMLELYGQPIQAFTRVWTTGYILHYESQDVPVVSFDSGFLLKWNYSIRVAGDTWAACKARQSAQRKMRLDYLKDVHTPAYTVNPLAIPAFVGGAIKEKLIQSGEACPISKIPFSSSSPATILNCFHVFDPDSIQHWTSIKNECPVCRNSVKSALTI